jgi:hypothetical protein
LGGSSGTDGAEYSARSLNSKSGFSFHQRIKSIHVSADTGRKWFGRRLSDVSVVSPRQYTKRFQVLSDETYTSAASSKVAIGSRFEFCVHQEFDKTIERIFDKRCNSAVGIAIIHKCADTLNHQTGIPDQSRIESLS